MLHCILGGCGSGKSTRLMEQLRESLTAGRRTIIIVPEQFSFEAEKKLYGYLGAQLFNRLHTCSFVTLSRDILQECSGASRNAGYASEQEKLLYLYQAVQSCAERKEFRLMERRSQSTDFIASLYGIITKLRKASASAERLAEISVLFPDVLSDKTHDLSCILLAYDRILQENGRHDSLVDLTEAAALAEMQYYFEKTDIYLDEFDSFTGDQYQMLHVILRQAASVTAAIRADDPAQRASGVFAGGNHTFRSLMQNAKDNSIPADWEYCPEYVRSKHPDLIAVGSGALHQKAGSVPYAGHVHLAEASDPLMEAEYIGAEICRLLQADKTVRCSDIVIAVKNPDVYFPLLERAFVRFALPFDLSMEKPVLHSDLIRYVLSLLHLLSADQWHTDEILRYLKSPFSGCEPETAAMLEHFCFTWNIDKEDWANPFWAEDNETISERSAPFYGKTLEELRCTFTKEILRLRRQCKNASVREICGILYHHLLERKDKSRKLIAAWDDIRQKDFVMLWNLLMDVLDTMADCFGDRILPMDVLRQSIVLLLRSCSYSTPPQTLDCIRIVDARTARLDSPAIVFVPGVRESEFPGEVSADGMFSQEELRQLEAQHIKLSRLLPELHSDELLTVRKTLAAASGQLYLTYPKMTTAHEPSEPAGVILEISRLFSENPEILLHADALPVSFYVRTLAAGYFHYVRHLQEDTPELSALRSLLGQDPVYHARLAKLVSADIAPEMQVQPEVMKPLLGPQIILSPSGIERFYHCAFQYFCQYVLRLYVPERNALTPRTGGDFAHYCLEQLLSSMDLQEFLSLTQNQLRQEISRLSEAFSAKHFSDATRRDGRFQFNYRVAGQSLLQLIEHIQKELQQGQFVPVGFEVSVSEREDREGFPPLSLQNGSILCHGGIDRVDLCDTPQGKLLRVVDYKTGSKTLSPEKLADGLDMQMLIYLFALHQNGAYDNAVPSGVFYMPSGIPKSKDYQKRSEKAVDREALLEQFYRMKGLLLEDTAGFMEPEIQQTASPVMAHKKDDSLFTVNPQQMQHLQAHVENKICSMADALRKGQVGAKPDLYQEYSPCGSCSFADLCGKAQTAVKSRTKEEHQAALCEVFGAPEPESTEKEDA